MDRVHRTPHLSSTDIWRKIAITLNVLMPMFLAKLMVVNDVFELSNGLLVFLPSVPYALVDEVHLRASDRLELRRPDGTVLQTALHALGRPSPSDGTLDISIKPFTKTDVPIGTEIWKVG